MATAYKLSTNARFTGAKLYPKGSGVRVRRLTAAGQPDMSTAGVVRSASRPAALGTGTGRQLVPTSGPGWVEVTDAAGKAGWVRYDLLGATPIAATDGKLLIETYFRNEAELGKTLARTRAMLDLRSKRISGEDPLLTTQKKLELRQKDRQRRIIAAKDVIKVTGFIDPFRLVFKPAAIKRWYGISGIGLAPLAGWAIAAGAVALVGLGWGLAAKHFTTDAKSSEIDLGEAKHLEAAVKKAGPKEGAAILAEIKAYGQKEYDTGAAAAVTANDKKTGGVLGEAGDLLKWGTIALIGAKILAII